MKILTCVFKNSANLQMRQRKIVKLPFTITSTVIVILVASSLLLFQLESLYKITVTNQYFINVPIKLSNSE